MLNEMTEGLVAAPFTPMHADQSLNLTAIPAYAKWLHSNGVVGAFICGTTGEGMSLSLQERKQVAEAWVASAPAGLRVIVHVGHNSLADCQELAAHAQAIGADSISCIAPSFFKPSGVECLAQWCEQVAAAGPKLPFYYYHMPSMTGLFINAHEFLHLAGRWIASLAGVKFTFEDLEDYSRCLQLEDGRFDVLFGRDELLLSALKLGAKGAVGSTYNYLAPLFTKLIAAYKKGDETGAGELQKQAVTVINAFLECGAHPIAAFKWFMGQVGIDCGPVRLPLSPPTPAHLARLEPALEASEVFNWVTRRPEEAHAVSEP